VANRSTVELESLIGFVSNTLVFRTRLGGNPTFRDLLGRVREMALDVYCHESVPFEKVVETVHPDRQPGVNPLFQVNLRVSGAKRATLELPGLEIVPLRVDSGFTRFDLALDVHMNEDGISGYFRYNRDIFEPATIERLANEFAGLLCSAVEHPNRRLLSFVLAADWNGSGRPAAAAGAPGLRNFRRRARQDAATPPPG
jgi:non-ribosomal peptide synthetase component F